MPLIGYARVSTRDQHPEAQTDALATAGREKTFTDHASGTLAKRPALDEALGYLRAGGRTHSQARKIARQRGAGLSSSLTRGVHQRSSERGQGSHAGRELRLNASRRRLRVREPGCPLQDRGLGRLRVFTEEPVGQCRAVAGVREHQQRRVRRGGKQSDNSGHLNRGNEPQSGFLPDATHTAADRSL